MTPVDTPLVVDVLMHERESWRPTSTGHLITRVIPTARRVIFTRERGVAESELIRPGHQAWFLHPQGEELTAETDLGPSPQIVLLDGNWREASEMVRIVEPWGRRIRLPMTGTSRYWLRSQQDGGRFSTMEALLFFLQATGHRVVHAALRLRFELHVYAVLCSRGKKADAAAFLADSPVREAFPALLAEFERRRPNLESLGLGEGNEKADP